MNETKVFNVKCTFENGDVICTSINGKNAEEVAAYYYGHKFNLGTCGDNLQKCTKVEFIY